MPTGVITDLWRYPVKSMQGDLPRDNAILRTVSRHNRIEIPGLGKWSCVGAYATVTAAGHLAAGNGWAA